jgi:hypothetical protein
LHCLIVCLSVIEIISDPTYEDFQDEVCEDSNLFFSKQCGKCP